MLENQINFRKINKFFIINQCFDFFPKENFDKIIDKNFLISVIKSDNIDILELILLKGINVNIKNKVGISPLNCAIMDDNLEIVKLLLINGANPNLANEKGYTSLFFAAERDCSLEIVQELINNNVNVNKQNTDNDTPLHVAIRNNHEAITKLLIENHANVNKLGFLNQTPLSIAVFQCNNIEIIRYLLNHSKININISDFAVLELFSWNNPEITEILKQRLNYKRNKKTEEQIKEEVQKYENDKKNLQNKLENLPSPLKENLNEIKNQFISNPDLLNFIIQNQEKILNIIKKSSKKDINPSYIQKTNWNNDYDQNRNWKKPFAGFQSGFLNKNKITTNESLAIGQIQNSGSVIVGKQHKIGGIQNQNIIEITKNKKYEPGFGGFKSGFLNQPHKSNNNSNSNVYVGDHLINIDTQGQDSNQKQQNIMYDVQADGSCLFWAVATSYLLTVRDNNEAFRTRFIQLFDEAKLMNLSHIQKLLHQFDLENNSNTQLWYQDQTANNLVINVFRNRVVNYIERNLDTISNHGGELTFRDLIQENNEIANNYLEKMREPSTWGGTPEIIAITNILNANISVNNDAPYQPINQNLTNTINIFHVNNGTHYNFALPEHTIEISNINSQETNTTVKNQQKLTEIEQPKTNIIIPSKSAGSNNTNVSINKPININIANSQETTTKKAINKYNSLSKEEKQQKLNEINQHYQNLSENDKKVFKDKLRNVGLGLTSTGISGAGILEISKMTGISPLKGLSTTANYIRNSLSSTSTAVSTETGEAMEMTSLLSESTVAEGLTAAETLSVTEGSAVVATEGAVIGAEAGTAAALAPETLGLSLVIGGLAIAGTAIIWWLSGHDSNTQAVKHESHNQYNEIEKYYKFLAHDKLKLDISINEWNKIKQIYKENSNNYQKFKNQIKSEITNFHKEDHSGWGGSITDNDINTLINIIYNHFQEINNHFLSNPNHGWKIVTNTIGSYFIIEEE